MSNAIQGIFTPKNYEIYHPNKNALSKNLSAKDKDKPTQMKYLNEWHKQCYEGIHTKSDEISFSKDELVPIFARFCLHKAKLYNHNSKSKQQKTLNYLLLQENHLCLSSFKIIHKWINHCAKNGLVSVKILGNILQMLESLLNLHNDRFAPNMSEEDFLAYFHSLSKKLKNSTINKYIIYLDMFLRYVGENLNIKVRCLKTIRKKFAKERTLPSFLNQSQFNDFLDFVKNMKANNLAKKRDRLIMLMVSYTGMRTKEVWNLKYSDIAKDNFSGTYIFRIQGKGLKTRLASVKIELIDDFLQDFIKSKDRLGIKTPYLFNLKNNAIPIQKSISLKPILEKLNAVQERGVFTSANASQPIGWRQAFLLLQESATLSKSCRFLQSILLGLSKSVFCAFVDIDFACATAPTRAYALNHYFVAVGLCHA